MLEGFRVKGLAFRVYATVHPHAYARRYWAGQGSVSQHTYGCGPVGLMKFIGIYMDMRTKIRNSLNFKFIYFCVVAHRLQRFREYSDRTVRSYVDIDSATSKRALRIEMDWNQRDTRLPAVKPRILIAANSVM